MRPRFPWMLEHEAPNAHGGALQPRVPLTFDPLPASGLSQNSVGTSQVKVALKTGRALASEANMAGPELQTTVNVLVPPPPRRPQQPRSGGGNQTINSERRLCNSD